MKQWLDGVWSDNKIFGWIFTSESLRMEVTLILSYNTSCGTGNMFERVCFPIAVAVLLTNELEKTPGTHLSRMVIFNTLLLT